jgi:FkbM family methyltransferase
MQHRRPLKADALELLKNLNVPVRTILDVGVMSCTVELLEIYNKVPHILMEPIEEFATQIHQIYSKSGIDYELLQVAMSSEDGVATLKTSSVREGLDITHARITHNESIGKSFRQVPKLSLNTVVKERDLEIPFLLKIDVDGAELDILKGAAEILDNCSVICIETGVHNFAQRANAILANGFELFDIVDICYYDNRLAQMDMIFVNSKTMRDCRLNIYNKGFDIKKWQPYYGSLHTPTPAKSKWFRGWR